MVKRITTSFLSIAVFSGVFFIQVYKKGKYFKKIIYGLTLCALTLSCDNNEDLYPGIIIIEMGEEGFSFEGQLDSRDGKLIVVGIGDELNPDWEFDLFIDEESSGTFTWSAQEFQGYNGLLLMSNYEEGYNFNPRGDIQFDIRSKDGSFPVIRIDTELFEREYSDDAIPATIKIADSFENIELLETTNNGNIPSCGEGNYDGPTDIDRQLLAFCQAAYAYYCSGSQEAVDSTCEVYQELANSAPDPSSVATCPYCN